MYLLVVESSNPATRSSAAELRALGHMVDPVSDPRRAIARASIEPYEAIVLDLAHAAESGLLVLHELRESDPEVPILVVSAHDRIHDRVTALIQGADEYLVRPFTLAELGARLEALAPRSHGTNGPARAPREAAALSAQLDRLVGNLTALRGDGGRGIGLVISEVKLKGLLERVCAALGPRARQKGVRLKLPRARLPTLLIDARWMECLLSSLLCTAISESPNGAEISISVDCDDEHCAIEIECTDASDFDLSQLRGYAHCLRLRLESPARGSGIRVAKLRRSG